MDSAMFHSCPHPLISVNLMVFCLSTLAPFDAKGNLMITFAVLWITRNKVRMSSSLLRNLEHICPLQIPKWYVQNGFHHAIPFDSTHQRDETAFNQVNTKVFFQLFPSFTKGLFVYYFSHYTCTTHQHAA